MKDFKNVIKEQLDSRLQPYIDKDVSEIKRILGVNLEKNKNTLVTLSKKMLNINSNLLFQDDDGVKYIFKTVRLNNLEEPSESMSFMPIKFEEYTNTVNWNETTLYKYFSNTVFIFMVFQQYNVGKIVESDIVFKKYVVWQMSEMDINSGLKEVWLEVASIIDEDRLKLYEIQKANGKVAISNNLPGIKFNYLGHLRPGGVNGEDKVKLATGQKVAKQRFWLNKSYIKEILTTGEENE